MTVSVFINSYDIIEVFGLHLGRGALSVLEQPPTPKEVFFNDWIDENGKDYDDTSNINYEPQVFDIPFLMKAQGILDYKKKRRDFLDLLKKDFDFQVLDWGESFRLRLKKIAKWEYANRPFSDTIYVRIILQVENNYVLPTYVFRYLADNLGRYIVINDNKRILVKTRYNA
ncbi:hypothetical protein [Sphingobacterium sp. 2149]|uniref:hypothetical protein n=1 Tax=Sphingobacterium sp. 2149 TaxID=2817763 RepID=UPI0028578DF9|nr:hypothetical protein [Sphingobacterium sp. 2149]MDR6734163.1 hypothetical protein [Sphingobacterium sp. 2149]